MRALVVSALGVLILLQAPASGRVVEVTQTSADTIVLASGAAPFMLGNEASVVRMRPKSEWRGNQISRRLDGLRDGERLFVVLRGKHAAFPPSAIFKIHIRPTGAEDTGMKPIGLLTFYDAAPKRAHPIPDTFESFEITDWVRDPVKRAALNSLSLMFEPVGPVESGAHPSIDRVELVLQR